jgi:hypothetical protein
VVARKQAPLGTHPPTFYIEACVDSAPTRAVDAGVEADTHFSLVNVLGFPPSSLRVGVRRKDVHLFSCGNGQRIVGLLSVEATGRVKRVGYTQDAHRNSAVGTVRHAVLTKGKQRKGA